MQFIILDRMRKFNCIEYIKLLPEKPVMGVSISEFKLNRSKAQNGTFHWWCDIIGKETGQGMEAIKDILKLRVLGTCQRVVDGTVLTEIRGSSKLDKSEFCNLMVATETLAHSLNIVLPYPDDYKLSMKGIS